MTWLKYAVDSNNSLFEIADVFKHRYKQFNYRIGSLTEYYLFSDTSIADAVLDDLNKMQPKVLSLEEQTVLGEANISQFKETETRLVMVN